MTIELRFAPPTKPWSTNEDRTMHWAARAKRIKAWRVAARVALAEHGVTEMGPATVSIELPFERGGRRDPMNYIGTCMKAAIDGLVDAGLWPDDTAEFVTIEQPLLRVRGDAVVLRITPKE